MVRKRLEEITYIHQPVLDRTDIHLSITIFYVFINITKVSQNDIVLMLKRILQNLRLCFKPSVAS